MSMRIPTTCRAAVVKNEGADFSLTVEDVQVPEPGQQFVSFFHHCLALIRQSVI